MSDKLHNLSDTAVKDALKIYENRPEKLILFRIPKDVFDLFSNRCSYNACIIRLISMFLMELNFRWKQEIAA